MNKHILAALMIAATLALAGCGGGNSGMSDAEKAAAAAEAAEQAKMKRMEEQKAGLMKYAKMLQAALTELSGSATREELNAAKTAVADLEKAIMAAMDVSAADRAMYQAKVADAAAPIEEAERVVMAAEDKARMEEEAKERMMAEAEAKAMTATAKALKAALGMNPLGNTNAGSPVNHPDGIQIDVTDVHDEDDDSDMTEAITTKRLTPAGSAGMHHGWKGMRYASTDEAKKVKMEALFYTTQGEPESEKFADWAGGLATPILIKSTETDADAWQNGQVEIPEDAGHAITARVMADAFTHSGTKTHKAGDNERFIRVRGTFQGAPGVYSCLGTATCTSTNNGEGAPSRLVGEWHFKPDAGAMVSVPDADYVYYGWWVRKVGGEPTHASAVSSIVGSNAATLESAGTLTGTATFRGGAAGKFAVYHDLYPDARNKAGHFTADAVLMADFGDATEAGTVKGTIDNFMLNDSESAPWSVALNNGAVGATGIVTTPDDATTTDVNESLNTTVWTLDGTAGAASGSWGGMLYKYTEPDSGNTLPDVFLGTFQSMYGGTHGTHTLVGAFGAERE